MYKYLIKTFLIIFNKKIKDFDKEKRLFFWLWVILFVIFELTIFSLFYLIFNYLINKISWWYLFAPKIMGIIIMIVFFIILILSFISTIPTLYKNKELNFLLTKPISYLDIFKYWVFKVCFYSSFWSTFILIPALVAFAITGKYWFFYYINSIFVTFWLTFIAWLLGVLLFLIFAISILKLKRKIRNFLFLIIWFFLTYLIFFQIPKIFILKTWNNLSFLENYIFSYSYDSLLYPYNWFSKLLESLSNNDMLRYWAFLLFIIFSTLFLAVILFYLWKIFYFESIENFNNFKLFKETKKTKFKSIFRKNKYINLLKKDFIVNIKDPTQISQIIIFLVLLLIYLWVIKWTTSNDISNVQIVNMITLWNLWIIGFFLWAIALRFVFPNVSIEWKSFWILKTIPIKLRNIFFTKIIFFSIIFLIIWYFLTYSYIYIVWINKTLSFFMYLIIFPLIISIITIFFWMWSLFPNFTENNPSKISTSFPWLLSVFIWNLIVFIVLLYLSPKINYYYEQLLYCNDLWVQFFNKDILIIYLFFLFLIIISYYLWYKRFKKIEI